MFSGIGAFEKALERQNIPFELINYCEIDKYASKSYSAIHNISEDFNLGDITKVNEKTLPDFDLMTWGFPCQDISVAGNQKGIIKGETRSGLYYEGLRILKEKKPKYSIIENVKALTQKKFEREFKQILKDLSESGYNNYWQVLNAKDYGIPQNRERVFIVSIRKDVDNGMFKFPKGFDNGIRLKDILEDEVDEKYYLSDKGLKYVTNEYRLSHQITQIDGNQALCVTAKGNANWTGTFISDNSAEKFKQPNIKGCSLRTRNYKGQPQQLEIRKDDVSNSVTTVGKDSLVFVGGIDTTDKWIENNKDLSRNYKEGYRVYDSDGIACCQKSNGGGIGSYTGLYLEDTHKMMVIGNTVPSGHTAGRVFDTDGISPTMMERHSKVIQIAEKPNYRIRKLTPLECWRLMGFDDVDVNKAKNAGISNTQLYKQAGNSIVVNVLEYIFKELFNINK